VRVIVYQRGYRPANAHSAGDLDEVLRPEIERQRKLGREVAFRGDAAFAKPEIIKALEETRLGSPLPAPPELPRLVRLKKRLQRRRLDVECTMARESNGNPGPGLKGGIR
jgi:hypothetical protein